MENNLPFVFIMIPCRNEKEFISKCLDSIIFQDYLKEKMEILVINGKSEDGTIEIVKRDSEKYPFIELLDNPELAITGYLPEDILLKPRFIEDNLKKIKELAKFVKNTLTIVRFVGKRGKDIYNAIAIMSQGKIISIYHKMCLSNCGVFDEKDYFKPGKKSFVFKVGNIKAGVDICENIWKKKGSTKAQAKKGARIIFTINAFPYHRGKIKERAVIVKKQAQNNRGLIAYTNLVSGQDELVFDGQSII